MHCRVLIREVKRNQVFANETLKRVFIINFPIYNLLQISRTVNLNKETSNEKSYERRDNAAVAAYPLSNDIRSRNFL